MNNTEIKLIDDVKALLVRSGYSLGECFVPYTGHNLHPKKRKHFQVPFHYYEINAKQDTAEVHVMFRRDGQASIYVTRAGLGTSGMPYYDSQLDRLETDLVEHAQRCARYAALKDTSQVR